MPKQRKERKNQRWRRDPAPDGAGWLITGDRRTIYAQIYTGHTDGTASWALIIGPHISGSGDAASVNAAKQAVRRALKRALVLLQAYR